MGALLRRIAAAGAVTSLAVAGLVISPAAAPAAPPAAALSAPARGAVNSPAQVASIAAYWTEERMRAATPEPMPAGKPDAAASPVEQKLPGQAAEGALPKAAAGLTNADGPISTLAVTRAERWNRQGAMPARTTGKVYFTRPNGGGGSCTGSVINARNKNTVWTAGHCIHPGGSGAGNYYRNFIFVPDADNGREPHGRWVFKWANTTIGWQNNGDVNYDIAAIAFYPQAARGNLSDALGYQGYKFGYGRDFGNVHNFGFPADGYKRTDFNGTQLWYCQGAASDAGWFDDRMVMSCDMGRGASGGPWLEDLQLARGWGYIVGSNSHRDGDSNGNFINNNIYSAYHGDGAINVYNDVSGR